MPPEINQSEVLRDVPSPPNQKRTFLNKVNTVLSRFFFIYIALVLIAIVVLAPSIQFACKEFQASFGLFYFLLAAILGIAFSVLNFRVEKSLTTLFSSERAKVVFVFVLGIVLLSIQSMIVEGCWFITNWDVRYVTSVHDRASWAFVFSYYPNNLFLAGLFDFISNVGSFFSIENSYLLFVIISCLLVTLSICLVSYSLFELMPSSWAVFSSVVLLFFVGCNPMILVPYSDSYGMLCPSIVLFFLICVKRSWLKYSGIVFFGYIGYCIKPTAIFVVCVIVFIYGAHFLREGRYDIQRIIKIIVSCLISFVLAFSLCQAIKNEVDVDIDESKEFSAAHFLMMGFNEETMGGYSAEDFYYSDSFSSYQDRVKGNLEEWLSRVEEQGFLGTCKLLIKKSLTNYDSGIFSFLVEGSYPNKFVEINGNNKAMQSWYGFPENDQGVDNTSGSPWGTLCQIMWIGVLIGIALNLFSTYYDKRVIVIAVTLLLLSVFLMLFESRARYLYLYSPYFIILGSLGWSSFMTRMRNGRKITLDETQHFLGESSKGTFFQGFKKNREKAH